MRLGLGRSLVFSVLVILFFNLSCQSKDSTTSTSASWNVQMRDLQTVMTDLLPLIVDEAQYQDPKNQKRIKEDVKQLKALSLQAQHNPTALKQDPSIQFIMDSFTEEVQRIDESLSLGKNEYARFGLLNVSSYCIECHTRTSTGPAFQSSRLDQALKNIKGIEKAEYLISTRQYQAAFDELMVYIGESLKQKNDIFQLEKAVRYALSVTVKFQKDWKLTDQVLDKISQSENTPYYMQQNVKYWKQSVQEWKNETKSNKASLQQPIASQLKRIESLLAKGQALQRTSSDRGGDIYFLRALSDLHLILPAQKSSLVLGQTLFLTGLAYESIQGLSIWDLYEKYYESCIRKAPGSVWAQKCYRNLESALVFSYSGSRGTSLPPEVSSKLQSLKKAAFTKND